MAFGLGGVVVKQSMCVPLYVLTLTCTDEGMWMNGVFWDCGVVSAQQSELRDLTCDTIWPASLSHTPDRLQVLFLHFSFDECLL